MKDYYKILGVDKNASEDEIKKAFRKQAHVHHPDKKGGDERKFKDLNEAYGVLSNAQKRKNYDQFGSADGTGFAGASGGGGYGGQGGFSQGFGGFDFSGFQGGFGGQEGGIEFDLGDILGDFFGGGRGSGRGGAQGGGRGRRTKGSDIQVDIELSFKEAIFGVERTISINKTSTCERCKGNGAESGTELKTCPTCSGKGQIIETRRSILGTFSTNRVCDECHGTGKIPKEKCHECRGHGVVKKQKTLTVTLPAGIENGQMVRLAGQGEAVAGGDSGDLYIKAHVKQDKRFVKQNLNLRTSLDIRLSDALLGAEITIDTLDGPIQVTVPQYVSFGQTLRIKGKGVPHPGNKIGSQHNNGLRGDLLIDLNILLPKKLSKNAQKIIEGLKSEGV